MRKQLHRILFFFPVFLLSPFLIAQVLPETGSLKKFVVFSSVGLITNTGTSYYTGDVGNNAGITSGFGNFDGTTYAADDTSQLAAADLDSLVNELNGLTCTANLLSLTATDTRFTAGVYCVSIGATLADSIVLDAQNDPDAVFVFNIGGSLTFPANTRIYLLNGAQACRVFWNVSGIVNAGFNSTIKGNIIGSNPAINAITLSAGTTLEGRIFATLGTINLNAIRAAIPLGCALAGKTGPVSPNLRSANCYGLFSSSGNLTNTGTTTVQGRIGTNLGTVTGYQPANISEGIFIQDASTAQAKTDIDLAYTYISSLPHEVDITFPALFGNGLTITPKVYRLNASALLSDTLFVNAQGLPNSVFVIKVNGDLTLAANARVVLQNGAKSCNVFWLVTGEIDLNSGSLLAGSIISDNDAMMVSNTVDGRVFTRSGTITTSTLTSAIPTGCGGCPFNPVNNAPTAVNDVLEISEDANGVSVNVLANDFDPDGDVLTASIISNAKQGTSSTNGTLISYKPQANFNGFDTIRYRACDSGTPALCDSAMLVVKVIAVRDKPVAVNDTLYVNPQIPGFINVTSNDYHPDGYPFTAGIYRQPQHGTATINNSIVTYTADAGFLGTDTLYYRIVDNQPSPLGDSAMVIFFVTDSTLLNAPVAFPDTANVCQYSDSNFIDVQANDFDANGDRLTTSLVGMPAHGNAWVWNDSLIVYTPQQGYTGFDTVTYRVCDSLFCDTAFVFISVRPAPQAQAGPDMSLEFGDSVRIGVSSQSGNTYTWQPATDLSDPDVSNPYASPVQTTTYTLTLTNQLTGCSNSDNVVVNITGDGFYNGLSPNNDGVNDYWKIPALNKYPDNEVTVVNRYGSEVWKASDYDNNNVKFTGANLDGDALPDGTYYYMIRYNNRSKEGWLVIKR